MLYVFNIIYNKESAESKTSLYISTCNQLSPILSNPNKTHSFYLKNISVRPTDLLYLALEQRELALPIERAQGLHVVLAIEENHTRKRVYNKCV